MPEKSITILHVSDLQFGVNHRFGLDAGTPDAKHDTLLCSASDANGIHPTMYYRWLTDWYIPV